MASGMLMRSDSPNARMSPGGFERSDSSPRASKSVWFGGSRRALFASTVLCTCAVILMQHVWPAQELVTVADLGQADSDLRKEEASEAATPLSSLQENLRNHTAPSSTIPSHVNASTSEVKSAPGIDENLAPVVKNATESSKPKAGNVTEPIEPVAAEPEEDVTHQVSDFVNVELNQDHLNATNLEENEVVSGAAEGRNVTEVEMEVIIPRAIPRTWKPPKSCATAEEMGDATVGDTRAASLRLRGEIQRWIADHGALRVRELPGEQFCRKRFVLGQALEDGFGNNMYKMLTTAGVAVMLNRSLILAERVWMQPNWVIHPKSKPQRAFGDYVNFSNETFTVREVRKLWAIHGCETKYNVSLTVDTDMLDYRFHQTRCTCDDWTALTVPVFEFWGATGAFALQFLLKNAHLAMRAAAVKLVGHPAVPDSRPNTFGELFRAFVTPSADIQAAVKWALQGGRDPDITLHLRIMHGRSQEGPTAASLCINRIREQISQKHPTRGRLRVVVVTDTPTIVPELNESLGQAVELIQFDYKEFAKQNVRKDTVLTLDHGLPPPERVKDWGEEPRWVAMVDFFLAARAKTAVVSGALRRVSTTYAQLVAALAAANTLDEREPPRRPACAYYSSFQPSLLLTGLTLQSGWGFSWRPFAGPLGCRNQSTQCPQTALQPYSWWDAPWQSPIKDDIHILGPLAGINEAGQVSEKAMDTFCDLARKTPLQTITLVIPSYEEAIDAS